MAAAQATGTVPRALPVIPAAEVYPSRDSYHAGEDQRTEREARQMRQSPAHWELKVRGEEMMLAYLRGAPSQRTTALGASIDRNAIMGGSSRICERCGGGGVLRPKTGERKAEQLLELIDVQLPNEPACRPGDLIGAPKTRFQDKLVSGRYSRDEDLSDPGSDWALVKAMAGGDEAKMPDVLRAFEPWCPICRGNGHIATTRPAAKPLDAQPTGGSKQGGKPFNEPVADLVAFGRASSVMRRVSETDEAFEPALVAYFGTTGARWAGSVFGKVFSVYPLTPAGQQILTRCRDRAGEADEWARVYEMATSPKRKRDVVALVEAAGHQAVALLARAGHAWDEAVRGAR